MEKMQDLKDLLTHEIQDLYSAETQLIEALPKMAQNATNPELKKSLTTTSACNGNSKKSSRSDYKPFRQRCKRRERGKPRIIIKTLRWLQRRAEMYWHGSYY